MVDLIRKFPVFLSGTLGVFAVYRFFKYNPNMQRIKLFFRSKRKIFLSVLLTGTIGVVSCGISFFDTYKKWSYSLKYTYEEASKGLCPNGTLLNISDIVGDEVLEKMAEKLDLDKDDLKGCLKVSSAMDNNSLDPTNPKITTDYSISCTPKSYQYDTSKLVKTAAEEYQDYFMENCAEQVLSIDDDFADMDDLEYQDKIKRLQIEAEKLKNYLSGYKWKNQGYQKDSSANFSTLVQKIDDYINVEIEKAKAFVTENGVAKNPDTFKSNTEYKNILLKKDYDKSMASYNVCLDAIDEYNSNMVSIVLVPTQDDDDNFYMSRTKIGVDYFATDASSYSSQAAAYKEEMDDNSYMLQRVTDSSSENIAKADEMIQSLETELKEISDLSKNFFKNFLNEKREGYLKIVFRQVTPMQALNLNKNLKYTFLCGCCLLILSICRKENANEESDK